MNLLSLGISEGSDLQISRACQEAGWWTAFEPIHPGPFGRTAEKGHLSEREADPAAS